MEANDAFDFEDENAYVEMSGGRPTTKKHANPTTTRGGTSTGERRTSFETWTQRMTRAPSTRESTTSSSKEYPKKYVILWGRVRF